MAGLTLFFVSNPPSVRLVGQDVYLRPPLRTDWAAWSALRAKSRGFLAPWEPSWADDALSRAAFRRRLARYTTDWRNDEGYSLLAFRTRDDALLGGIGLSYVRRGVSETASLGYWIGEPHARQGYMSQALRLMLAFSFDRLGLHRVEAACLPENAASRRLLARSGFQEEGRARGYLCINNQWQDHILYAILRDDWLTAKGTDPWTTTIP